jgi:hypothetical protein
MKKSLVILFCLMGLAISQAANALTFELMSDHCTGGCGPAPFGQVTLAQDGTTVDVAVSLANGIFWAKTGAVDFEEFKFNVSGSTGPITVDQTFPGQMLAPQTGSFNGDGTGTFGHGIACTTCGNGNLQPINFTIMFHVANATIAQLTSANAAGNVFVADIFSSATGNTGPVDATVASVPDGGWTVTMIGSTLLALGVLRRRFSNS